MVLWFVAGMSVLVAGIVMSARTDVRLGQVHYARAQVTAAGDGAINLLLADIADGVFEAGRGGGLLPQRRYRVGDDFVSVLAIPEAMLVDMEAAPPAALAAVAERSGAVAPGAGQSFARAVVQFRDGGARRRGRKLDSIEDLLGVKGMNRATLDALRDYITVGGSAATLGGGGAPFSAATLEQLARLGPESRARSPELQAPGSAPRTPGTDSQGPFRIDALVRRGTDVWLRRRWVRFGGGAESLPWRFTRTEPVRMVPRS
jgi:type II secretory pathway component PulK